ncbi:zinc ribbon domain-containing protein [Acidaminococcus sp. DS4831]|uniref:zinc ribbon domain-containing protein n=1 Tax=Acidaminococcus sp. DS4831 TaxID=3141399 RepID=UPI0032E50A2F
MDNSRINTRAFIAPGLAWVVGLMLILIFAPRTDYVNGMVGLGFLVLCMATICILYVLYKEYDRTGKEWPFFLDSFFPNYPVVPDSDELSKRLSGFRRSLSDYLSRAWAEQNSDLQSYASQMMWHSVALQKKRLLKNKMTLEMDSVRRAYSGRRTCVRENTYFDGKYQVKDIYEEIAAVRTFKQGDRIIKRIKDSEVAHFTMLSANQVGGNMVTCPSCGNTTTRENLLDGCDYCGTKFTVEDMENRVDSFGLRRDFRTNQSKKNAVKELIYPWTTLIMMTPLIYFGLLGTFVYLSEPNIFLKLVVGIFIAGLLGLLGWCFRSMFLLLMLPIGIMISTSSGAMKRKMIYSRKEEEEQEKRMADQVRKTDPLFSLQSFFGGIQNKLSAIHYAEFPKEINAFSEKDLSSLIEKYKNVVDVDIQKITMESYRQDEKLQSADVSAKLRLLELQGNRIKERSEKLKIRMIKDASCKTQAVCGVSVMRCQGCGASLSLMEGKTCSYCGRNLDLKSYDWVIDKYDIV